MTNPAHRTILVNLDPGWDVVDLCQRFLLDLYPAGRQRRFVVRSIRPRAAAKAAGVVESVWGSRWPRVYDLDEDDPTGAESLLDDLADDVQRRRADVIFVLAADDPAATVSGLRLVERFVSGLDPAVRRDFGQLRCHAVVRLTGAVEAVLRPLPDLAEFGPAATMPELLLADPDRNGGQPCERMFALTRPIGLSDDAATTLQFLTLRAVVDLVTAVRAVGTAAQDGAAQPLRAFFSDTNGRVVTIGLVSAAATRSEFLAAVLQGVHDRRGARPQSVDRDRDVRWQQFGDRLEAMLGEAKRGGAAIGQITIDPLRTSTTLLPGRIATWFDRRRLRPIEEQRVRDNDALVNWGLDLARRIEQTSQELQERMVNRLDTELRGAITNLPLPAPGESGASDELNRRRRPIDDLHTAWLLRAQQAQRIFEVVQPRLVEQRAPLEQKAVRRIGFAIEVFSTYAPYVAAFQAVGDAAERLVPLRYLLAGLLLAGSLLAAVVIEIVDVGPPAGDLLARLLAPEVVPLWSISLLAFLIGGLLFGRTVAGRRRRYIDAVEDLIRRRDALVGEATAIARAAWDHMLISAFALYPELALSRLDAHARMLAAEPIEHALAAIAPRGARAGLPALAVGDGDLAAIDERLDRTPATPDSNWIRDFMLDHEKLAPHRRPAALTIIETLDGVGAARFTGETTSFLGEIELDVRSVWPAPLQGAG
ncbi:hypothetical protein [Methylobrevis albus]|uniref:Uncharacterized protein n=1 Tax=Methylobrevis albus TaxID=2793297 RepID=A0A931I345_9HYPH|nr:hypothetical protein [Methylobrevis albus]MBH0238574.1 hypothetical protein [Methylobrevis albus]